MLSIVSQWDNYDEHTSCYMEHILRFRLCVAYKHFLAAGLGVEDKENDFREISLLIDVIYFYRVKSNNKSVSRNPKTILSKIETN